MRAKRTTGRLYFMHTGFTGWHDFGNVIKSSKEFDTQTTTSKKSKKGMLFIDFEQITETGVKLKFTLDERTIALNRLLYPARYGVKSTVAAVTAPNGTASFSGIKQGQTYFVGKNKITSVVLTAANSAMVTVSPAPVAGTDYILDADAGSIKVVVGGTIPEAGSMAVTFGAPSTDVQTFTKSIYNTGSGSALQLDGIFKFVETDKYLEEQSGYTVAPYQIIDFTGKAWVSNPGDKDGKKYNEVEITIRATNKPTILCRA